MNKRHPSQLRRWRAAILRLATALHTTPEWDADHQVLILRRPALALLRPGMLLEAEIYVRGLHPARICLNFVAEVTASGASFTPGPLLPLTAKRLALATKLARRHTTR